ncbi:MAG: hypothetical protein J3R72DRAFT_448171 [Linnemannia gamsii]|nr:MAG: hypothetical protein J3R72DRAFT_448171 [Linnemannia gamsii]
MHFTYTISLSIGALLSLTFTPLTSAKPVPATPTLQLGIVPNCGIPPQEKPTCAVKCANIDDFVCAGPSGGCCGMSFRNSCMLAGFNCNHPSNPYIILHRGLCRPKDIV